MSNILIPTKSPEDWKAFLSEPDKQWKSGYSARALAYCWEEANGFPASVQFVFSKAGAPFYDLEPLLILPEHKVPLPGGQRPSQNDIWVLAKSKNEMVSIAVEGKVSEHFGPTLQEWMEQDSPGKRKRLEFLKNELCLNETIPKTIRYQLLHRTASAIIEARRFNAAHAVMMVHSFSQTHEWFDDYSKFLGLFNLRGAPNLISSMSMSNLELHFAWIQGEERYLSI